jgi:hypothetical protein
LATLPICHIRSTDFNSAAPPQQMLFKKGLITQPRLVANPQPLRAPRYEDAGGSDFAIPNGNSMDGIEGIHPLPIEQVRIIDCFNL